MRLAISGAHGFLGHHLVARAAAAGHEVVSLVTPWARPAQLARIQAQSLRLSAIDLAEDDATEALAGCEAVLHLAARAADFGTAAQFERANVLATRRLLEAAAAAGVGRLVLLSSLAVHRYQGQVGADVRLLPRDRTDMAYGMSKAAAEELVLGERRLRGVVVRPGLWPVGSGDHLLPRLLGPLRAGRLPLVGGDGVLNLVDADDLAEGLLLAATVPEALGVYAIADPQLLRWREVLTALAALVGGPPPGLRLPPGPTVGLARGTEALWQRLWPTAEPPLTAYRAALMQHGLHVSVEAAARELGWRPRRGWREALRLAAADAWGKGGLPPRIRLRPPQRARSAGPEAEEAAPVSSRQPPAGTGGPTPAKVLIATIDAGGGHTAAARAWGERFEAMGAEVELIDAMAFVGPQAMDRRHKRLWRRMLGQPRLTWGLQRIADDVLPGALVQGVQGASLRQHGRLLAAYAGGDRGGRGPADLVFCTHPWPLHALTLARAEGLPTPTIVGFNPDVFDAHALWGVRGSDLFCAATEEMAQRLQRRGLPAAGIRVSGYPLARRFTRPAPPLPQAKAALGLEPERPLLLLSLGAEGVGPSALAWWQALAAQRVEATVAVMAGRSTALLHALQAEAGRAGGPTRLLPLGFRDDVPAWLAAADLVLAKAGPASTLEALAVGAPIAHLFLAGPHEQLVRDYALMQGVGAWWPEPRAGAAEAAAYLRDPAALAAWRARVGQLDLPLTQQEDVRAVLALAARRRG